MDTHAFLWWLSDDPALGAEARQIMSEPRNQVLVSAASIWEISIKQAKGMLEAPADLEVLVEDEGFTKLPISLFHGQQAGKLPEIHRDPFDRMLIAQAQAEGLELVTADGIIPQYGVRVVSAKL
ncbi:MULTISPECIES: type II toxin-antitoxin system VapC family toxin [unclassified Pseudomonas]|uniref:type II toxin-antitoxin system VapC family toxin n=1 Tax=unclassified Pseudomonas TaxID=196821 RepID=UPI002113D372|nr:MULTISPECIES: type II toxin-antitoxin system VapC family toxin [unclassified Pseudomonas]MDN4546885.1 type II toxin-antitoxin system VapC family toxin [Pseudomonas sp. C32]